jgi:hypothetical protein
MNSYEQMTHSYAQIVFVLGEPLTTALSDPAPEAEQHAFKWRCGCQSTGPFQSMVWNSCELHAYYKYCGSFHLNEDTLLPAWDDLGRASGSGN